MSLVPFNRKNNSLWNNDFGEFYNMVDDFFGNDLSLRRSFARDTFKLDVQENENEYVIEAELPGVNKDELNLDLDAGRLTISVKREENVNEEHKNYVHKERKYSSMSRSVYLANAKSDNVKANLDNGVLSIKVPKQERPNNKYKIEIE